MESSNVSEVFLYDHPFGDDLNGKLLPDNILHFVKLVTSGTLSLTAYIYFKYPILNTPENILMKGWSVAFAAHFICDTPVVRMILWTTLYRVFERSCIVMKLFESLRYFGCIYAVGIYWNWILMFYQYDLSRMSLLLFVLNALGIMVYIMTLIFCYRDVTHTIMINIQIFVVLHAVTNIFPHILHNITNQMIETKYMLRVSNIIVFCHSPLIFCWYLHILTRDTEFYKQYFRDVVTWGCLSVCYSGPLFVFYDLNRNDINFHNSVIHLLKGLKTGGSVNDCNQIV